jgi:hypothetical protein
VNNLSGLTAIPETIHTNNMNDISIPDESSEEPDKPVDSSIHPPEEIMEVHHHPDLHHDKKYFREYFLEFIMIFLAVTLGFFAENLREQMKDHKQIQQSLQSLKQDLRADAAMYDSSISINVINCNMIDTLILLLHEKKETGRIYFLARKLTVGAGIFTPNSKTFEQLKSTGSLRLIENQQNLDSINAYYQMQKYFDYWSGLQRQRINDVIAGNEKLFDGLVFFSTYKSIESSGDAEDSLVKEKPVLISNDPLIVNDIIMHYQYLYGVLKIINKKARESSVEAKRLAVLLDREYDLDP